MADLVNRCMFRHRKVAFIIESVFLEKETDEMRRKTRLLKLPFKQVRKSTGYNTNLILSTESRKYLSDD